MRKSMYRGISVGLILCMTLLSACGKNTSSDTEAVINAGAAEGNTQEMTGASDVSESASEASTEDAAKDAANESLYNGLFNTNYVHTVDIEISDDDWSDLLANPLNKTKYHVNVTIDGETIEDVSFATKGNTSLSSVASDKDSDRYSFKINFGKYVDDQTYYGLDKLNLNNIYADATYLKDYLSYQLFNYMGVDASLTSYVSLTVNGKAQGLYLAIEDVSDSFLARTDNSDGALYKPETASLDNAGMKDGQAPDGFNPQDGQGGQQGGDHAQHLAGVLGVGGFGDLQLEICISKAVVLTELLRTASILKMDRMVIMLREMETGLRASAERAALAAMMPAHLLNIRMTR